MNKIKNQKKPSVSRGNNSENSVHSVKSIRQLALLLLDWFSANARDLPWRRTRDPYAIWVSEIMLQQTQVKTVIPYWKRWMRELPTIEAVARARSEKIHKLWEGLGYYTRARNLQEAARQIVAQQNANLRSCRRGGNESQTKKEPETPSAFAQLRRDKHVVSYKFPDNFDDVLALPGIGRYTAGAICSIAFNQPTPILDGNVIRVLTRVFGVGENPREKTTNARLWRLAEELVGRAACSRFIGVPCPPRRGGDTAPYHSFLNQSLMELGALVCTPRNPQCQICPVKRLCAAFRENRVAELPNLGRRTATTARRFIAFVIERNGKFLVRQRPAGIVNAHLWEFPNVEIGARLSEPQHARLQNTAGKIPATDGTRTRCGSGDPRSESVTDIATQLFGVAPTALMPLCTMKHSITRYRITLEAFRVKFGGANSARPHNKMGRRGTPPSEIGVWLTPAKLDSLALTAAHKQILSKLKIHDR
ncbi:MAG: A/G-specific adenine glycosylase [Limisphaerales bacterium]